MHYSLSKSLQFWGIQNEGLEPLSLSPLCVCVCVCARALVSQKKKKKGLEIVRTPPNPSLSSLKKYQNKVI